MSHAAVVASLLSHGLLEERSIVDGDVAVVDASRRNENFKVVRGHGASYFVKRGVGADRRDTVAHEAAVYEWLESSPTLAPISTFLPRRHAYDRDSCTLVLDLVGDGGSLAELHRRRRRFGVATGTALGRALGTLHRITATASPGEQHRCRVRSHIPALLRLHHPTLDAFTWMSHAAIETIKLVQQSAHLHEHLDRLSDDWREDAMIHGDPRWDNWVIASGGAERTGVELKLVDWEMAGIGDPCWDVGVVLGEYVASWLLASPLVQGLEPAAVVALAPFPLERIRPASRAVWRSYTTTMRLDAAEADTWCIRTVRYAAAWLVQTAYERMLKTSTLTEDAIYLLQVSTNILDDPIDAAGTLFGLALAPSGVR